jgi:hypothetical protein
MAIVNRDLDASQQKIVFKFDANGIGGQTAIATGATIALGIVPAPAVLSGVLAVATGVSNAMQVGLYANRWLVAGLTSIALGASNLVLVNYSSSGVINGASAIYAGSSAVALQMGDQLIAQTSVSNGNALTLGVELSLKLTQDIVALNGNAL